MSSARHFSSALAARHTRERENVLLRNGIAEHYLCRHTDRPNYARAPRFNKLRGTPISCHVEPTDIWHSARATYNCFSKLKELVPKQLSYLKLEAIVDEQQVNNFRVL